MAAPFPCPYSFLCFSCGSLSTCVDAAIAPHHGRGAPGSLFEFGSCVSGCAAPPQVYRAAILAANPSASPSLRALCFLGVKPPPRAVSGDHPATPGTPILHLAILLADYGLQIVGYAFPNCTRPPRASTQTSAAVSPPAAETSYSRNSPPAPRTRTLPAAFLLATGALPQLAPPPSSCCTH